MYKFTDSLLIGEAKIDQEHKMLFQMLNDAQAELDSGFCPREAVIQMKENLVAYANTHFEHEEAYMRSLNDPELAIQEHEHNIFRKRVDEVCNEIDSIEDAYKEMHDLIEFVAKWLFKHIINSDCLIGKVVRVEESNADEMFAFTDKYITGIEMIDREHKELFRIVERAYNELQSFDDMTTVSQIDTFMDMLDDLTDYTKTHFADEEEYMLSIDYDGLDAQVKAHQMFVEKLEDINPENVDMPVKEYFEDIIDFLLFWLTNHILKVDTLIPIK